MLALNSKDFIPLYYLVEVLEVHKEDIDLGFMPNLGLADEPDKRSKEKWQNAWRNLNRDYKNAIAKMI